jgi:hypothetical protein
MKNALSAVRSDDDQFLHLGGLTAFRVELLVLIRGLGGM